MTEGGDTARPCSRGMEACDLKHPSVPVLTPRPDLAHATRPDGSVHTGLIEWQPPLRQLILRGCLGPYQKSITTVIAEGLLAQYRSPGQCRNSVVLGKLPYFDWHLVD